MYSKTLLRCFWKFQENLTLKQEISYKGKTEKFYFLNLFVNLLHMCAEFVQSAAVLTHSHSYLTI
jgi:hypothetical protein